MPGGLLISRRWLQKVVVKDVILERVILKGADSKKCGKAKRNRRVAKILLVFMSRC
jgi:hypothetical protein